jgi:hypothetical protein
MHRPDLRWAYFVAVTPAKAAELRRDPSAVTTLRKGAREETGLGHYWYGVQYLLIGRAKGVRGAAGWPSAGGEDTRSADRLADRARVGREGVGSVVGEASRLGHGIGLERVASRS